MTTKIEWAEATWNPATGCSKISPGCSHCYMYAMYPRLKAMGNPGYPASPSVVTLFPERLDVPVRTKKPTTWFVCSMSDLFHKQIPFEFILQVFQTMFEADQHTYQVLTKRPHRAKQFWQQHQDAFPEGKWPANIWMGTSIESQRYTRRLEYLTAIPAPVKFVSAEPLIDKLSLVYWLRNWLIQWVIVGGESGPGARPMDILWAQNLRDECHQYNVPYFLKQLGGSKDKQGGDKALLEGEIYHQMPCRLLECRNSMLKFPRHRHEPVSVEAALAEAFRLPVTGNQ